MYHNSTSQNFLLGIIIFCKLNYLGIPIKTVMFYADFLNYFTEFILMKPYKLTYFLSIEHNLKRKQNLTLLPPLSEPHCSPLLLLVALV